MSDDTQRCDDPSRRGAPVTPERAPQASIPPPIEPRGFFTGVKIRPIVIGAVVDYVATHLLILLYLIVYHAKDSLGEGGVSEEAFEEALKEALSSQEGLLALILIGAFCTALGGYIAGRLAKSDEVKHGALVGALSLIVGLLQAGVAGERSPVPQWYELLGYLLAIPAGALGGLLAQGRPNKPIFPSEKGS
ncbi:MAG: TIGR04086 family membrane protein [Deltaproteobacteria bacterium]|nr:TIGR04086 family membrane protein [Deltaproteobacteria bacterium]